MIEFEVYSYIFYISKYAKILYIAGDDKYGEKTNLER